jgi:hypothetical protein
MTQVSGLSNLVTGMTIPIDSFTYAPLVGSSLLNSGVALPELAANLPPLIQYSPVTHLMSLRTSFKDMGAVESSSLTTLKPPTGLKGIRN